MSDPVYQRKLNNVVMNQPVNPSEVNNHFAQMGQEIVFDNPTQPRGTYQVVNDPNDSGDGPYWDGVAEQGRALAHDWKDRALAVVPYISDGLRLAGIILPLLIAVRPLQERIVIGYTISVVAAIFGLITYRKQFIRNGIIGFIVLKFAEDFITVFVAAKNVPPVN